MSAFIVGPETMARVLRGFELHDEYIKGKPDQPGLCLALYAMNVESVCQRYEDERENFDSLLAACEMTEPDASATLIEILKAVCCLKYQCSEGDVPETALYAALEKLESRLMYHILRESADFVAAYDFAPWNGPREADKTPKRRKRA